MTSLHRGAGFCSECSPSPSLLHRDSPCLEKQHAPGFKSITLP